MTSSAVDVIATLFEPRSVAIVGAGATPDSMGSRLLQNIVDYGFEGKLFAVNRNGERCGAAPGYQRVVDIPEAVDVCFVAVAAKIVPAIVRDCAEHGVRVTQIFSSTYGEPGDPNAELLRAAAGRTRLIGPNCLGTHSPGGKITYMPGADRRIGTVAIVSQSGGLTTDMIHQARVRGLRLGKVVSIGDSIDLGPADFLEYLAEDDETSAIGFYLEGTRDPRLGSLLRETAPRKPIVIVKGGRTAEGAASAVSHTGALAGDYAVWQAALAQAGAIAVETVDDLLATLTGLQRGIAVPGGNRVAMIGNGGGITVLTTDVLAEEGMTSASLTAGTIARIDAVGLPAGCSLGSALDVPANALTRMPDEAVRNLFAAMIGDDDVDLMIAHFNLIAFGLYPGGEALARVVAEILATFERHGKPVYVALRGSPEARIEGYRRIILDACERAGLPCFAEAIEAARVAARAHRREAFLARRRAEPAAAERLEPPVEAACRTILESAKRDGRTLLAQGEAFALLDALGIGHTALAAAFGAAEAAAAAGAMGFPVALKIDSPDVVHKTESGGVRLGLDSPDAVRSAYDAVVAAARASNPSARIDGVLVQRMAEPPVVETIAGINRDPQFGAVVMAGIGGIFVELLADVALRVAPVGETEARAMWRGLRARRLFEGFRGAPAADTAAFEDAIVRLSLAAATFPQIAELDVNPLFLYPTGASAVDCRVRLTHE